MTLLQGALVTLLYAWLMRLMNPKANLALCFAYGVFFASLIHFALWGASK